MAFNEKGRGNLKELYESLGAIAVVDIIMEAIQKDEIKPEEISIRELWDAFTDNAPLMRTPRGALYVDTGHNFYPDVGLWGRTKREAVGTGSFEKITGALISKTMIEGYNSVDTIGQYLVTEMPGKLKKETITGTTAHVLPLEVPEGKDYEGTGFEEKYVTIKTTKWGRIIDVTEELIMMDQTGQILLKAKGIGEGCAAKKEQLIVQGCIDANSNVWMPGDSAVAIYGNASTTTAHTGDNLAASNPFGAAGLAAVEKLAHQMTDDSPETNYMLASIIGKPALFPVDLMEEAWELSSSPTHPETAERAPSYWRGKFVPYTSPWITANSSSYWYWGDFKRCFLWINVWPLQTMDAKPGHYREFEADIKSRHKVRFYGGVGARDFRFVFKST
ncbi:MAG: hypothetical protein ABID54_00260 [Pseudomonadota bacterium]